MGIGKSIGPPYYPLRFGLLVCIELRYVYIIFGLFPYLLIPHQFYVETKALETHLSLFIEWLLLEASSLSELSIDYTGSQKDSPSSPQDSLEIKEVHHKILCKVKMYGNAQ